MNNLYATLFSASALLLAGGTMAQSHSRITQPRQSNFQMVHSRTVVDLHGAASRGGGAPANDECSAAEPLTIGSVADCPTNMVSGTNAASTITPGDPTCDLSTAGYQDVFYSFNSGSDTVVTVNLTNIDATDFAFTVQPTCDFGAEIACEIGPAAPVNVSVTPNTDYLIRVYANTDFGAGGAFTLCISSDPPPDAPSNDACSGAVNADLAVGSSVNFTGTTAGATVDGDFVPGSVFDANPVATVWHSFTTTECANVTVSYCGTTPAFGTAWVFLAPSCPAGDDYILAAPYDFTTCSDLNPTLVYSFLPAGTYYLPVQFDAAVANGPYTIDVSATECVAPTSYCIPNPATGTTDGDFIATMQLEGINYTGPTNDANYVDNTALSTDLARNSEYTMTITGGDYAPDVYAAWIDYNNDFMFDQVTEKLGEVATVTDPGEVVTITFTVPLTANLGPARLRVRGVFGAADMIACTDYTYGETEDYTVNIQTTIGVSELNSTNMSVYPNPSNGDITIGGTDLTGDVNFELMDMTGRVVYQDQKSMSAGQPVTLALNGKLAQGTYSLRVITANGISSRAVMIK